MVNLGLGQIVDMTGQVLKTSHQNVVINHRINLNRRMLHLDYNWEKTDAILEKCGTDVGTPRQTHTTSRPGDREGNGGARR